MSTPYLSTEEKIQVLLQSPKLSDDLKEKVEWFRRGDALKFDVRGELHTIPAYERNAKTRREDKRNTLGVKHVVTGPGTAQKVTLKGVFADVRSGRYPRCVTNIDGLYRLSQLANVEFMGKTEAGIVRPIRNIWYPRTQASITKVDTIKAAI